jgi:RNA polymerase sigma factor (sigma-70 family)
MTDSDFRAFIKSERQRLVGYVRSLLKETTEMDAEDVVHDVLVRLLERPATAAPLEYLAAYVYRSLRNRVIDSRRTRKPTLSLDAEDGDGNARLADVLHDITPDVLELLQSDDGKRRLFAALEQLNEQERNVIIAHEFEGIPFKQLSATWHIPQNTLLSHKSRALKKLKRIMMDT